MNSYILKAFNPMNHLTLPSFTAGATGSRCSASKWSGQIGGRSLATFGDPNKGRFFLGPWNKCGLSW